MQSSFTDSVRTSSATVPESVIRLSASLYFEAFINRFDRICDRRR